MRRGEKFLKAAMDHRQLAYEFPARTPPPWASAVDRWPQLDAYAYGLPEIYHGLLHGSLLPSRPLSGPDLILLASPEASNQTDLAFVNTGSTSPAKFVHTLPNSRSAALLQVMAWSGPLLCLQDDPQTVAGALFEAVSFAVAERKRVWVFSVERRDEQHFTAHLFDLRLGDQAPAAPWTLEKSPASGPPSASAAMTDRDLFAKLQNPGLPEEFMVFKGLQMTFKDRARG